MTLLDDRPISGPLALGVHPAVRPIAAAIALVLLLTAPVLFLTLPEVTLANHWSLAWAGLDVATALAALATVGLIRATDPRAALTAIAGATLLVTDAWFDVCTAAVGFAQRVAVAEALGLELPLAVLAVRLALRLLAPEVTTSTASTNNRAPRGH